jgi:hypothetical protein
LALALRIRKIQEMLTPCYNWLWFLANQKYALPGLWSWAAGSEPLCSHLTSRTDGLFFSEMKFSFCKTAERKHTEALSVCSNHSWERIEENSVGCQQPRHWRMAQRPKF